MHELGLFPSHISKVPTVKGYSKACDKLPVKVVKKLATDSHINEFEDNGILFKGLKVIITDGTKISLSSSKEVIEEYGEGEGHYPQCSAVGFFELSTRTFEGFEIATSDTSERAFAYNHMKNNNTRSLYLNDAGYNGMAFIAITKEFGHEILMPLKMGRIANLFRSSKKRSEIYEIKLNGSHLKNYENHEELRGKILKVRLIKTRGTSKLKSQVLITTLLDDKEYPWQTLANLYRQRYLVEVAFRHLKVNLCIESIRKRKLSTIKKFLYAAIALFNLAAMVRNRVKKMKLLPEKHGTKSYCFSLCLDKSTLFCLAAIKVQYGIKQKIRKALTAIRNCWYIYKPWRAEPRICNTPPSKFSVQKGADKQKEIETAKFLCAEYKVLREAYE